MLTGIHEGTYEHIQLGAGMFLTDIDPDRAENGQALLNMIWKAVAAGEGLLGATRDGGVFRCVPALRQVEADGSRGPRRGAMVNDGWTVRMTGTMLEMTPENMARALGMAEVTRRGGVTVVRPRAGVREGDYLDRLCWVGQMGRGLMLIEMTNALNMNGAVFTFADRGEGTLAFEFQAHADGGDDGFAPCRILFYEGGEDA